jgi:hypothetical protein
MTGRGVLRAPAFHFLALGAALLAAHRPPGGEPAHGAGRVVVTRADVERLRDEWTQVTGAPPTPAAEARLVARAVDEGILHREALALGLDRRDGAVRERLRRLGRFLGEEPREEAALEREARRLGLEQSDLLVKRHLVQMMELAAGRLGPEDLPTEGELQAYLEAHAGDFAEPERLRFTHVYLGRDRHREALARDAVALLAALRDGDVPPEGAAERGDPFLAGASIGPAPAAEVARLFGPAFARALAELPTGAWAGPLASSYGLHLVWLERREPGRVPSLASVRNRVLHRVLAERSRERGSARLQALRARYQVDVAGP